MRKLGFCYAAAAIGLVGAGLPWAAGAQTLDVLGSFAFKQHGDTPLAGVIRDSAGNLFGTTTNYNSVRNRPKAKYYGTVFEVKHPGGKPKLETIWRFGQTHDDGQNPWAPVVMDAAGNLYGETFGGGPHVQGGVGSGTIFELSPPVSPKAKWSETVLYDFPYPIGTNGAAPIGGLLQEKDGSFFGVIQYGGEQNSLGYGTVFKLDPPKAGKKRWTLTTLYAFQGGTDGIYPTTGVVQDGSGALYGTTLYGGTAGSCLDNSNYSGCGTVFKLTPPAKGSTAWTESVIWTFQGASDGAFPMTNLVIDAAGNLYASTFTGGTGCPDHGYGCGTIVELSPPADGGTSWTEAILAALTITAGGPQGNLLMQGNGSLTVPADYGSGINGAIVQILPPNGGQGWTQSVLYSFPTNDTEGQYPIGLMQDAAGNFFGTTELGGPNGGGVVFELTP